MLNGSSWNGGGEAGHDANDASPHLQKLMPNGSGKPNQTTVGAKERITWSIFCQDVPNIPSFNLVQCSISKLLTNDYYNVLSKYFNLEIDRTVRVKRKGARSMMKKVIK